MSAVSTVNLSHKRRPSVDTAEARSHASSARRPVSFWLADHSPADQSDRPVAAPPGRQFEISALALRLYNRRLTENGRLYWTCFCDSWLPKARPMIGGLCALLFVSFAVHSASACGSFGWWHWMKCGQMINEIGPCFSCPLLDRVARLLLVHESGFVSASHDLKLGSMIPV